MVGFSVASIQFTRDVTQSISRNLATKGIWPAHKCHLYFLYFSIKWLRMIGARHLG